MRINLLPPEIVERQRARRRTIVAVAVGLAVLAGLAGFYFLQVVRLGDIEEDITAQEARNQQLQTRIDGLQDVAALETEISVTRNLLASLLEDRVLWSGILRDVALVIPSEAWLEGLAGQVADVATTGDGTEAAPTGPAADVVGQITFNGRAFSHRVVALWLSRLEDVRGFINPWLTSSTKVEGEDALQDTVQFTSSVDLSEQAVAGRGRGGNG